MNALCVTIIASVLVAQEQPSAAFLVLPFLAQRLSEAAATLHPILGRHGPGCWRRR